MTNPSTKILLPLLALAMMTGTVSAQQRTLHDARANVVGRSSTDSSGAVTSYDARGRVISRESTSGNTTTIYDAGGRNVGRVTTSRYPATITPSIRGMGRNPDREDGQK